MKQIAFIFNLFFLPVFCFSQQNLPGKIIGQIPDINSTKLYQIQVGAFKFTANAENVFYRLIIAGFAPAYEKHLDYTRVIIAGIPANQIMAHLTKIKQSGFDEVIIREVAGGYAISEKWEITTPGSTYASFEFNQDHNYIVIENSSTDESEQTVHFGEYSMPAKDVINLINLGILKIESDENNDIHFSFSSTDEPDTEVSFEAVKAERIPESPEIDLFCRTWRVVNSTDSENIGLLLFISNAGTYFFTTPDGESNSLSRWRWYNDNNEEFEYSHDNWHHYGRVKITNLTKEQLEIIDPGFISVIPGYSSANLDEYWKLEPINY